MEYNTTKLQGQVSGLERYVKNASQTLSHILEAISMEQIIAKYG